MATYKVIKLFTDLKDGGHRYNVGDPYPREGVEVSDERIAELSGSNNRQKTPLIKEAVSEAKAPAEETEAVNDEETETVNVNTVAEEADEKPKRGSRKKKEN